MSSETIYKVTIEVVREEESLTDREWRSGGDIEKPDQMGYTPQVREITAVTRTIASLELRELDTKAVLTAVIDAGRPLEGDGK